MDVLTAPAAAFRMPLLILARTWARLFRGLHADARPVTNGVASIVKVSTYGGCGIRKPPRTVSVLQASAEAAFSRQCNQH
jgi:hypothetical protein